MVSERHAEPRCEFPAQVMRHAPQLAGVRIPDRMHGNADQPHPELPRRCERAARLVREHIEWFYRQSA